MGESQSSSHSSTMKAFIFSSDLLAMGLVSDASIANQQAILVGGLCPTSENPAECEAGLPDLWKAIALALWPGYYDPSAEWMCGPTCAAPEDVDMTCDDCVAGIQASIDQLLDEVAYELVMDLVSGV